MASERPAGGRRLDDLDDLYRYYGAELRIAHSELVDVNALSCGGLATAELEALYLLVRDEKPRRVVEIGTVQGRSTSYLLQALKDNGQGSLHTTDLLRRESLGVPSRLSEGRWSYHHADVRRRGVPDELDFLVINAAHSRTTTSWYLRCVLPFVPPGTVVALRDVDRYRFPLVPGAPPSLDCWLERHGVRGHHVRRLTWFDSPSSSPLIFFRNPVARPALRLMTPMAFA